MLKFCFFLAYLSFSLSVYCQYNNLAVNTSNNKIMKYVPDEIIIQYKTISNQNVRGSEILDEHSSFVNSINSIINNKIVKYNPVFAFTISEMIQRNETENEIVSSAMQNMYEKKLQLLNRAGSFLKPNFNQNISAGDVNYSRVLLLKVTDKYRLDEIINELKGFRDSQFEITRIERNYIYQFDYIPDDPLYSSQWSHKKTDAEAGWDISQGDPNIIIGILDSGVDLYHEDLADNIVNGYDFVNIDTNDYKSPYQYLCPGEDYVNPDSIPMDFGGHGTHCAGIAAAKGNGKGVIGVAPKCSIMPLRAGFSVVTVDRGEIGILEEDDILSALQYAVLNGVDIISMSFGSNSDAGILTDYLNYAHSKGIVLVASAGNGNSDDKSYPACNPNVISVAATGTSDEKAYYSNFGTWIDIAAPGDYILSTIPRTGGSLCNPYGYGTLSGTSMAAPYIAGVAGLLLSKNPDWNPDDIKRILKQSVDNPSENLKYIGTGRINIKKALEINSLSKATAEINYPTNNFVITANCTVTGRFTGSNYSLYYGVGLYPSEWTLFSSGNDQNTNNLGLFNVSGKKDTLYTLRLVASDAEGQTESRIFFRLYNTLFSAEQLHNFPITFYNGSIMYAADSKPVIYDVNRDGKDEIILVINGTVHVLNSEGKDIEGWPQYTQGSISWFTPAVADLNGDGFYEIVSISNYDYELGGGKTYLNVWDCEGKRIPFWTEPLIFDPWLRSPQIVDIDNDGNPEIILTDYGGWVYVYSNSAVLKWKKRYYVEGWSILNVAFADINNDGFMELICCSYDTNVYILDHFGELIKTYNVNSGTYEIAVCDINKDSKYEGVQPLFSNVDGKPKGVGVWDLEGNKLFTTDLGYDGSTAFAIGDIDNDTFPDIVFNVPSLHETYVVDHNGKLLPGWPQTTNLPVYSLSNILIADVNNDGFKEIILGFDNGDIIIYNHDGTKYSMVSTGGFVTSISIGDIDGDHIYELICHNNDGKLYAWRLSSAPVNMTQAPDTWPMFLHDINHSANYHYKVPRKDNYPPVLTKLSDYSINEDDSLTISLKVKDADSDRLTLTASVDTSAIITRFDDNRIMIKPKDNWFGTAKFKIKASDGKASDSSAFSLIVKPVNDQPVISAMKDTVLYYGDTLKLKIKYWDIDNTLLTCTAKAVPEIVNLSINDSTLFIIPKNNLTGNTLVQVVVSDGSTKDTSNFKLIVKDTTKTGLAEVNKIPYHFSLYQNYPNPFNPVTQIRYDLPEACEVKLRVFNIIGECVKELVNKTEPAGYYSVLFDAANLSSGIYIYKLTAGKFVSSKKLIILK